LIALTLKKNNKMKYFITTMVLFCLFNLKAQTIQFPLDPARYAGATSIAQANNGAYTYNSIVLPESIFGGGKTTNLTSVSLAQGLLWSKDYLYTKTTFTTKMTNFKDGYLLTGGVSGGQRNKLLMRLDADGDIIWSKLYGESLDNDTINGIASEALVLSDGNLALAGGTALLANNNGKNDFFLAKIDTNGTQIWSKRYCFSCANQVDAIFSSVIQTPDEGFLLCGSTDKPSDFKKKIVLIKTNSVGVTEWIRNYDDPDPSGIVDELGTQVLILPSGNFALIGNQKVFNDNSGGIIAEIKPDGTLVKSFRIRFAPNLLYTLQMNKAVLDDDGALVISAGVTQDSTPTESVEKNLLFKFNLNGSITWQHNYYDEILVGFGTAASDLVKNNTGGFGHLTNFSLYFDNIYPILVVTDAEGKTGCELPSNLVVQTNLNLVAKTITVQEQVGLTPIDYPVQVAVFEPTFILPSLDIGPDRSACEIGNVLLDATVFGADSYLWNDGTTEPELNAATTGTFSVTVTDTDFCLKLVDSIKIEEKNTVSLELEADTAGFCANQIAYFSAVGTGEKYVWSTGEMSTTITVTEPGLYIVTASNDCATVSDSFLLSPCPLVIDTVLVQIPNAFTPNGDNTNDIFEAFGKNFRILSFQIYARWGELVFEGDATKPAWDGLYKGKPAPQDVYVYVLKYNALGKEETKKGDVTLIR
jgi:gliding motility-associated-like protein